MSNSDILIHSATGHAISTLIPNLADLRIRVFSAYPYLYVGSVEYEKQYLQQFASAPDALVVTATNAAGDIVGCATGSALTGHHAEFAAPLAAAGWDLSQLFYFGESVLDAHWRGHGVGHAFFDGREAHAKSRGYRAACFCAVVRSTDDPRRPADYSPLDTFWAKRGYHRLPGVEAVYDWPEIEGGPSLPHPMAYWIKEF
jgi:GNAT superfamily N-acetyltransferase